MARNGRNFLRPDTVLGERPPRDDRAQQSSWIDIDGATSFSAFLPAGGWAVAQHSVGSSVPGGALIDGPDAGPQAGSAPAHGIDLVGRQPRHAH